jgi:hypothetical protein
MSTKNLWGLCEFHENWSSGSHTLLSDINEFLAIFGMFIVLCIWNLSKEICTTVLLNIFCVKTYAGGDILTFVNGIKLVKETNSPTKHTWCSWGSTNSLIQKYFDSLVLWVYIKTHSLEANTSANQNHTILCSVGTIKILCRKKTLNTGSGQF